MKKIFTKASFTSATAIIIYLMVLNFVLHVVTGWQYGIFFDESYTFSMSSHLDYGYVDITPVVPWLMALSRFLLGNSIVALHVFPALAGSFAMLFAALTARKMGGGKFAQSLTAVVVMVAPVFMTLFSMFIYDAFDQLMSAVVIFMVAKLLKGEFTPRIWILFGFLVGIGVMVKITMGFLVLALIIGLLLTRARKHLAGKWFWISAAITLACFIPYVIWQWVHGFPIVEYLHNYRQTRTVTPTVWQLLLNIWLTMNPLSILLWLGGLVLLFTKRGRTFRPFAWAFLAYFTLAAILYVKFYALTGVLLPLTAFGAVALERNYRNIPLPQKDFPLPQKDFPLPQKDFPLPQNDFPLPLQSGDPAPPQPKKKKAGLSWTLKVSYLVLLCLVGGVFAPLNMPVLSPRDTAAYNSTLDVSRYIRWDETLNAGLPSLLTGRIGWEDLARTVSDAYHALPESDQKDCQILCMHYADAGAIDYYSEKYGIPQSISGHLSFYYWGNRGYDGKCLIIVGVRNVLVSELENTFDEVTVVKGPHTDYAMVYQNDMPIYICKGLKVPVEEFWQSMRNVD